MINIIEEKPNSSIHGRTLYNTRFVEDEDIQGKSVLDIGCGYGWMELNLLNRGASVITGIEISEKDLETAKKYINDPKVKFRVGSAIQLPFENNSFDTVVSWEVIEHIPENTESKMFEEIWRVLKPCGCFYLSTPYDSFFSKVFDPAWWLIKHRHYSRKQLSEVAEIGGFALEKSVLNGGWWEIIGINNLYVAKWVFRRKPFYEKFINKKQDCEYNKHSGFTNIFAKFVKGTH